MNDIKMTGIDPETFDRIKKNISRLLTSSLGDDNAKKGPTNVEIYNQIYGDRDDIQDPSKANKIAALRRGDGISLNDIIKIAAWKGLSLDWLILGKEPTVKPPTAGRDSAKVEEAGKEEINAPSTKSLESMYNYYYSFKKSFSKEQENTLIKSLLNSDYPILQICSSFLNLLTYADISIIGDYVIDNTDAPQSLKLEIRPKCFWVCGRRKFDKDHGIIDDTKFHLEKSPLDPWTAQEEKEHFEHPPTKLAIWDYRATLVQRLIALAIEQQYRMCFDAETLLKSVCDYMCEVRGKTHYDECNDFNSERTRLSIHQSLREGFYDWIRFHEFYPLDYFLYSDDFKELVGLNPLFYSSYCDYEEVSESMKNLVTMFW